MLASRRNGTFYVGMTDDLARRIHEHKTDALPGFTRQHRVTKLVRYEVHDSREAAFARERMIKRWRGEWKIALVLQENDDWRDLCETLQLCRPGPMDPRFCGVSGDLGGCLGEPAQAHRTAPTSAPLRAGRSGRPPEPVSASDTA